jgi:hypothetical protein
MKAISTVTSLIVPAVVVFVLFGLTFSLAGASPVLPQFDADNFSDPTKIDNPWLSLPVGAGFEYEGETADGTEIIQIEIPGDTKKVMGITTLIYRDTVHIDGELVEDTYDYLAQDDDGNVWYFGEDVDNYENGKLADHGGSWLAGKDGALPGYWMPADPEVGDEYRQEYYKGEAEDVGEVVTLTATVKNKLATYTNCLKTKDTNPLEPSSAIEYKYYCKQVSALVLEEKPEENERVELVDFELSDDGDDEMGDDENDDADDGVDDDEDEMSGNSAVTAKMQTLIDLLTRLIALLKQQRLN